MAVSKEASKRKVGELLGVFCARYEDGSSDMFCCKNYTAQS